MLKKWLPAVVVAAMALSTFAAEIKDVRAIWLWAETVRKKGVETVVDDLAKHHINMAVILVKGINGMTAWDSKVCLKKNTGDDLLHDFAAACKKKNIAVHAWFVVNSDGVWIAAHPEDGFYHAGSAKEPGIHPATDKPRVCPLSQGYRKYLLAMIKELASQPDKYPIDGIHLDYIRYPHVVYCFCPNHQAKAKELGINLDNVRKFVLANNDDKEAYVKAFKAGDPDVTKWVKMREAEIEEIVKNVKAEVKAANPKLQLSAAFMPEGGEANDLFGRCNYAQNYDILGPYMDFICPMTYHREFKKPATWPAEVAVRTIKRTGVPTLGGFADLPDAKAVVDACRERNLPGVIFFQYATIKPVQWKFWDEAIELEKKK